MANFCVRCGIPLPIGTDSDFCSEHGGPRPAPNAQIRCPFCRELILAGAQKCRYCGEFVRPREVAAPIPPVPHPTNLVSGSRLGGDSVARRAGRWAAKHPLLAILIFLLSVTVVISNLTDDKKNPGQPTISGNSALSANNLTTPQNQYLDAPNLPKHDSSLTAEQREGLAAVLDKNFKDRDVEINVFSGGAENEELVLSSELLKDSTSRTHILGLIRAHWQDQLCKAGFKTIVLSDTGIFDIPRDYPLRCPWTANDRAVLAASIKGELSNGNMIGTVEASGPENEILTMITNYEAFSSPADRAAFFEQMRQRSIIEALCGRGFRTVIIKYSAPPKPVSTSQFALKCSSQQ